MKFEIDRKSTFSPDPEYIEITTLEELIALAHTDNPYHAIAIQLPGGPDDEAEYDGFDGYLTILDTPYWD